MTEKIYKGGCHCGQVRYEVSLELGEVTSCNCSICSKKAWLLTFTSADKFKLLAGDTAVTDYLFHKKAIHHVFCATCGISSFCRSHFNPWGRVSGWQVLLVPPVQNETLTGRPSCGKPRLPSITDPKSYCQTETRPRPWTTPAVDDA